MDYYAHVRVTNDWSLREKRILGGFVVLLFIGLYLAALSFAVIRSTSDGAMRSMQSIDEFNLWDY